jgi:hypothetical protein
MYLIRNFFELRTVIGTSSPSFHESIPLEISAGIHFPSNSTLEDFSWGAGLLSGTFPTA